MDSIRKKMQSLKYETDGMIRASEDQDIVCREANEKAEQCECDIRDYSKKISKLESAYEETFEALQKASSSLLEKDKEMVEKEQDLSALSRRVQLLDDELLKAEIQLAKATLSVGQESKRADKVIKTVNQLNSKAMNAEVEIEELGKSEKEAKFMLADAEKKYDEISRRLGVMEEELRRTIERADNNQKKVENIDEELRIVGENMKSLEVSEEKALQREEKYKDQIAQLMNRLKLADGRAEYGEMNITKLNQRIDGIEDDIIREKMKEHHLSDEMDDTFKDIMIKYA